MCYYNLRKGEFMDIFTLLKLEFGTLYRLSNLLGIRETAVYQWKSRNGVPLKHIRSIVALSEGRITKELLRPDIFKD
ncbi:Putative bacterial antitoxin YdaS [uncultured Caudovirales phage]|jgi:DNA-binding transcriptional regulator YdaS (Cro superfamily)|uniref:Bacterial antitoxin YdaS n=1 Tax=uncultured Caudovirales phage TaxID=2100421 RepID=A0A6J5PMS5_9CAUD|nr:Putative bacterial antitoxin YdaS [uncultured Caudovirales phage]CAB4173159.1 Putative bacterial antitoxin YdaS [uncultured Caudovirales phage]CAB4178631.1 Putative bacterial antitoxin YdaS [uncultured Caudovirales phage]CAB4219459.1 Putative bacterial antitoxin YdaS [uncultured Caudovirales phage]